MSCFRHLNVLITNASTPSNDAQLASDYDVSAIFTANYGVFAVAAGIDDSAAVVASNAAVVDSNAAVIDGSAAMIDGRRRYDRW
jgi:hypothetical protein